MTVVGVDGCPGGWVAVAYEQTPVECRVFETAAELWAAHGRAETILVDIPIGLRADSAEPRACDTAAREVLGRRGNSVFPAPIRPAAHAPDYERAKAIQERHTEGSLGRQTWAICDKIAELDELLRETPEARETVREAHPEVCFWALAGGEPTRYSKTGQPAAAVWERVDRLEAADADALERVRTAGRDLGGGAGVDDLLDAFALALTASDRTGPLRTLPGEPPRDPAGLPMEMVYARL